MGLEAVKKLTALRLILKSKSRASHSLKGYAPQGSCGKRANNKKRARGGI